MTSFSDNFNRADSTDLGASWSEVSGDWSIISNRLSSGNAGGTVLLRCAVPMATNDHSVQITIAATAPVSHGVWCRGNGSGGLTSGYLWRNDGTTWDLFSVVGGSFSVIGTYAAAAAPDDVAKLQVVGSTVKGFVNGVQRVSVTDTGVASGTSCGVRAESTNAVLFDDFTAADVLTSVLINLGTAVETGAAQPLTRFKRINLGTATDLAAAQAFARTKIRVLAPAVEQGVAGAFTRAKVRALGAAVETGAAGAFVRSKLALLGPAVDTSASLPFSRLKVGLLAPAETTEVAQRLAIPRRLTLGTATEINAARPLVVSGPNPRPADLLLASSEGPTLVADHDGPTLTATSTTGG